MNEGNTGKIYFLSGRGRRSTARVQLRKKSEPAGSSSGERLKPSTQETTWLARALFIEGMYFALLWLAGRALAFTSFGLAAGIVNALFPIAVAVGNREVGCTWGRRDLGHRQIGQRDPGA